VRLEKFHELIGVEGEVCDGRRPYFHPYSPRVEANRTRGEGIAQDEYPISTR
jgi:hypothetical protein